MIYTATGLRKNIYSVLDSILDTGIPAEIERNGKLLKIVPENPPGKLERLEPHTIETKTTPELHDIHWENTWSGKIPE